MLTLIKGFPGRRGWQTPHQGYTLTISIIAQYDYTPVHWFYLFIYLDFNVAFNTVQVISRRVVLWAEETST